MSTSLMISSIFVHRGPVTSVHSDLFEIRWLPNPIVPPAVAIELEDVKSCRYDDD